MGVTEWLCRPTSFKLTATPVAGQTGVQSNTSPFTSKPKVKRQLKGQPRRLPRRLVGSKCTAEVLVAEKKVYCLLDSGSQVTTVPLSFYENNLKDQEIKPLDDLLEVEGANGQEVPYFGYVELDITFPKEFVGGEVEVPTLALMVPNMRENAQEQILIGTNTLDMLYSDVAPHIHESGLPIQYGYRAVLKALELRHRQGQNSKLGFVKLAGKNSETVPAGHIVALEGSVHVGSSLDEKWAVVEHPTSPSLPGGLLVANC